MKEKKLEWEKPVLRDLGEVLTVTEGGSCSPGYIYSEECGVGTDALVACFSGNVNPACGPGSSNPV